MQEDDIELGEAIRKSYTVTPLRSDLASSVVKKIYRQKNVEYFYDRLVLSAILLIGILVIFYSLWLLLPLLKTITTLLVGVLLSFCWLSVKEFRILLKRTQLTS